MRFSCLPLACGVLAAASVSAQERPDFSGEWVRVGPLPETEAALVVRQGARSITIDAKSSPGPRPGVYGVGTSGGVVADAIDGCGGSSLRWMWNRSDATLIVTHQQTICSDRETKQSKHQELWSLDTDRLLVIVITDEETGAAATTTRLVYRRR